MPQMKHYFNFMLVNLFFIAQIAVMLYYRSASEIRENWPAYRCNPPYWLFSEDIMTDFNYCVQSNQQNMFGYLLQPMNYMVSGLTSVGSGLGDSINQIRVLLSSIREFVSDIIDNVFGVFLNLIVEFQKIILHMKDMVGKMIGIVVTILYVLDGSIKTMNSVWAGPPGQIVKAIGSCFHPDTEIELLNHPLTHAPYRCRMQSAPLGGILPDGSEIFAVLRVANPKRESVYKISTGESRWVYVTGDHFVWDREVKKWIQVRSYSQAEEQVGMIPDYFTCLITSNRRIVMGKQVFWDWEDDELQSTRGR